MSRNTAPLPSVANVGTTPVSISPVCARATTPARHSPAGSKPGHSTVAARPWASFSFCATLFDTVRVNVIPSCG
jgi:hypothetical protein